MYLILKELKLCSKLSDVRPKPLDGHPKALNVHPKPLNGKYKGFMYKFYDRKYPLMVFKNQSTIEAVVMDLEDIFLFKFLVI